MSRPAPAGWYRAPDGSERYWTGDSWSDQFTAPATHPNRLDPIQDSAYAAPLAQPFGQQPYGQQGYAPGQPVYAAPARPPGPYGFPQLSVMPKSPAGALIASFFIPGLGQLINGEVGKAIAMFVLYALSWVLLLVVVGLFGIVGIWIWSMIDAYSTAQRWNLAHGIVS